MKKQINVIRILLLSISGLLFSLNAHASNNLLPFDNFFLFGDSLSDVGNNPLAPFTTPNANGSGGNLWANNLGNTFGVNVTASSKGGNDYAYGGAVSGPLPFGVVPTGTSEMTQQVQDYLSTTGNHADQHALYSVWAGANDLMDSILDISANPDHASIIVNASTNNLNTVIGELHDAGANYILASNLPDIGNVPASSNITFVKGEAYEDAYNEAIANGDSVAQAIADGILAESFVTPQTVAELSAAMSELSALYNAQMLGKLNADGFNIIQVDIHGLLDQIQANAQKYGFSGPDSSYCVPGQDGSGTPTLICSGNPNQDIFFDGLHPSQAAGIIIADYDLAVMQAPMLIGILAEAPFAIVDSQNSNIQNELIGIQTGTEDAPIGRFKTFISGFTNRVNVDANGPEQHAYDNDNNAVTVGTTYRLNQQTLVGIAVGRSMGSVDFGNNAGQFDMDENLITAFGGYNIGNWFATSELNAGVIDFSNIQRDFMLGPVAQSAEGDTTGYQFGLAGNVGYNFTFDQLKTGPILDVDYQYVNVKAYAEKQYSFDNMQYANQNNNSLLSGLGWQASYDAHVGTVDVLPFIQATYNHQFLNMDRDVSAGVVTLPGSQFSMPVSMPNSNFVLTSVGVQTTFVNGLTVALSGNASLAEQDQRTAGVMLSLAMPL